jgi:hypothetical protein
VSGTTPPAGKTPPAGTAGRGALPAIPDTHMAFNDVKVLTVTGKKGQDQDVVLNFVAGQISISPKKGGAAMVSVPYQRVVKGTYIHAKDPKWDDSLPAPPDGLDIPGFMRGSRHWLVLQTKTDYLVLRLDDSNWSEVLDTVEARTGLKVDRPSSGGK